jgi:hypothetical protein
VAGAVSRATTASAIVATALVIVGIAAEFWIFDASAYGHAGRTGGWYLFLVGSALLVLCGVAALVSAIIARLSARDEGVGSPEVA